MMPTFLYILPSANKGKHKL